MKERHRAERYTPRIPRHPAEGGIGARANLRRSQELLREPWLSSGRDAASRRPPYPRGGRTHQEPAVPALRRGGRRAPRAQARSHAADRAHGSSKVRGRAAAGTPQVCGACRARACKPQGPAAPVHAARRRAHRRRRREGRIRGRLPSGRGAPGPPCAGLEDCLRLCLAPEGAAPDLRTG